jgi:hypothetical protein
MVKMDHLARLERRDTKVLGVYEVFKVPQDKLVSRARAENKVPEVHPGRIV